MKPTTNLQPMTYGDALRLYFECGRHPFSFMVAPYGLPKTIAVTKSGNVTAQPPSAVLARYEWMAGKR